MLLSLHIENIAVIKNIDIDFGDGFIALTGETGAGKSIIIDSINLLLGKKAEKELIRTGESSALVSGLFGNLKSSAREALSAYGINLDDDGTVLVQRSISLDGHSGIKVNGRSVNLSLLRAVTPSLISIHGQTDTLSLTDNEKQTELIDLYADNASLLTEYDIAYREYVEVSSEIKDLASKERERERLIEIYEYQIKDIDLLSLHDGEEEELIDKKLKIKNSERITKNAGFVFKALKGSEKGSVAYLLDRSISALSQIADVSADFSDHAEKLRDMLYQVEDISEEVYAAVSDMDTDPDETLNKIESRLDKISKAKRKYGLTIKDVLNFRDKTEAELDNLKNSDSRIKILNEKLDANYREAEKLAVKIHEFRCRAAAEIVEKVKETLEFLDMPKVVFFASIKENFKEGKRELSKYGCDSVEFFISPNRGADPMPLAKIASGGELARVMLALKSVIADKDNISGLVFDEIDSGVSGKTARKIGIKMLGLSKSSQIFSVTHSAQIASLADRHFLISKSDKNGSTETCVTLLDKEGRIKELSRILGGIDVTDAQRRAAEDMLDERENYLNLV